MFVGLLCIRALGGRDRRRFLRPALVDCGKTPLGAAARRTDRLPAHDNKNRVCVSRGQDLVYKGACSCPFARQTDTKHLIRRRFRVDCSPAGTRFDVFTATYEWAVTTLEPGTFVKESRTIKLGTSRASAIFRRLSCSTFGRFIQARGQFVKIVFPPYQR